MGKFNGLGYYKKLLGFLGNSLHKIKEGKFLEEEEIRVFRELWILREEGNIDERQLVVQDQNNMTESQEIK